MDKLESSERVSSKKPKSEFRGMNAGKGIINSIHSTFKAQMAFDFTSELLAKFSHYTNRHKHTRDFAVVSVR